MKKELLILAPPIPPNHLGGDGKFAYDISIALSNIGIKVILFSPVYNKKGFYKKLNNLTIITVPIKDDLSIDDKWDTPIWDPEFCKKRNKVFYQYLVKYSLLKKNIWVHEIGGSIYNSLLEKITKEHNIKYSCHMQIVLSNYDKNIPNKRYLKKYTIESQEKLINNSEKIFFLSKYDAKAFKLKKDRYEIVPNGIDFSIYNRIKSNKNNKGFRIFIGGRLNDRMKGTEEIFRILNKNLLCNKKINLHISAPDKTHFDIFDEKIKKQINYHGWTSFLRTQKIIEGCDLSIVPSKYEPFGLIAAESISNGVPVFATKTGGLSEIIKPGINGEFIEIKKPDKVFKKIHEISNNQTILNKYKYKEMKESVKKYDINVIAQLYLKHLKKFLMIN